MKRVQVLCHAEDLLLKRCEVVPASVVNVPGHFNLANKMHEHYDYGQTAYITASRMNLKQIVRDTYMNYEF